MPSTSDARADLCQQVWDSSGHHHSTRSHREEPSEQGMQRVQEADAQRGEEEPSHTATKASPPILISQYLGNAFARVNRNIHLGREHQSPDDKPDEVGGDDHRNQPAAKCLQRAQEHACVILPRAWEILCRIRSSVIS
jgi:hypothetical protein